MNRLRTRLLHPSGTTIIAAIIFWLVASVAWAALTGSANISVSGGVVSLTGTISIENGGTNNPSLPVTDGVVVYMDGSKQATTGLGSSGQCLKSNGGGAPTFAACATTDTNTVPPLVFGTTTVLPAGVQNYFVWPGTMDTSEEAVAAPIEAGSYSNLRCRSSAIQGASNDVTVTLRAGSCGTTALSSMTDSSLVCTLTGSATNRVTCNSTATFSPTIGQCVSAKVSTPAALTNPISVSCTMERTA